MKQRFLLCPYDGFKIRIYSSCYVDFLIQNSGKYNLSKKEKLCKDPEVAPSQGDESSPPLYKLKAAIDNPNSVDQDCIIDGFYGEFSIKIRKNKRLGTFAEIEGSFHKFFYNGQNFKNFYWKDFLTVYAQFVEMFALNATTVAVVNLEVGINVKTLLHWIINARSICRRVLFFNPPSRSRGMNQKQYKNNGMGWISEHTNFWLKVYDKIPRFGIAKISDILRLEKRHIKSGPLKKLGVLVLSDLLKQEVVEALIEDLFKTLSKLIIKQPISTDSPGLTDEDAKFLADYGSDEAWDEAYLVNSKRFDKDIRKKYESLIRKYCPFDLKQELLSEARYLLNQKE